MSRLARAVRRWLRRHHAKPDTARPSWSDDPWPAGAYRDPDAVRRLPPEQVPGTIEHYRADRARHRR